MPETTVITKDQYLAMTPQALLKDGFRDAAGEPRPELNTIWATAGAVQMEDVSPREFGTMLLAIGQVLPLHEDEQPSERYRNSVSEAAEVSHGVLGAPVSPRLIGWLESFAPAVHGTQDLEDLLRHLGAVARQHSMFAGMRAARPA
jgi:hypothetical protein